MIEQAPDDGGCRTDGRTSPVTTLVVSGKSGQRIASTAGSAGGVDGRRRRRVALWPTWPTPSITTARAILSSPPSVRVAQPRRWRVLHALAAGKPADGVVGPHEGAVRRGHGVSCIPVRGRSGSGMGRQLLADEPVFAEAVAELEPAFRRAGRLLAAAGARRRGGGERGRAGAAGAHGPAAGADRAVAFLRGARRMR